MSEAVASLETALTQARRSTVMLSARAARDGWLPTSTSIRGWRARGTAP